MGDQYLEDFQPECPVEVFDDYTELIQSPAVDAVNDLTAHHLHHPIALACERAGKPLLTQKPLAMTPAQGNEMVRRFESKNLPFGVCENWRFRPPTRHAKWAVDSGILGTLQQLLFFNVGNWWAPRQVVAHTPWRHRRATGGGITLDIGPHLFHWARHIGGEIESVTGQTQCLEPRRFMPPSCDRTATPIDCDADDTFSACFKTDQDVIGTFSASWAGAPPGMLLGQGPQILGSEGRIDGDQRIDANGNAQPLADLYRKTCPPDRQAAEFPAQIEDGFALLQLDWLNAIQAGRQPESSGREGLADLACAFAVLESSRQGMRIRPQTIIDGNHAQADPRH